MFILTFLIFPAPNIAAHPGNTVSDGCHFCRTNCEIWGWTYDTRHGHHGETCDPSEGPIDPLYVSTTPMPTTPVPTTPVPTTPVPTTPTPTTPAPTTPVPTATQIPSTSNAQGRVTAITRVGDCQWAVYMEATGLRPGGRVWVSDIEFDCYDCQTGVGNRRSWGPVDAGVADSTGHFVFAYTHNDYGTYHYVAEDDAGNRAQIDISYGQLTQTPIVTPTPIIIVITPSPTTPRPAIPTTPATPSASVQLHGEKTDVLVGEDIVFKLSAVNKITKPVMTVQVILIPPSGMSVTSSEFATSGAGQYTTTYKLDPGAGKDIEVRIKTNQQGDFNVKGEIVYYYGDNKSTAEEHTLNLPIKVKEIPKTPAPTPQSPTISFWGSLLIIGISYSLIKGDLYR